MTRLVKQSGITTLVICILNCLAFGDDGFKELFDGKSLNGWRGDARYWSVADGVIVGNTKPDGMKANTFLIADGSYADFELQVKFRLINGASGIQFRSVPLGAPDEFLVTGYQSDIDNSGSTGEFYEEKGRSTLVRANAEIVNRYYRQDDWNTFVIRMLGNEGVITVNGQETSRYTEKDPNIPRSGLVALQLQAGPGMEIAFKDIRIREIKPDAWKSETMLVSNHEGRTKVRAFASVQTGYANDDPQLAIEWALDHGRTTVVLPGKYLLSDGIDIPRDGVTLIVSEGAEIELRPDTQHTSISFGSNRNPGYWQIVPLIYNKGHDRVRILELGTLVHSIWDKKTSGKQTFPIIFDGRNAQKTCEIEGGMLLVTGQSNQSFWLVDSRQVDVPMLVMNTGLDAVLVLEGCQRCTLGTIANLATSTAGNTGETVDLNSRNQDITIERLVGERPYEIIDCNESHAVVYEAVSIGKPRKLFGGELNSGPRFTARPSHRTRSLDVKKTTILDNAERVMLVTEAPDILTSLPKFSIRSQITVKMKDSSQRAYSKEVEIDIR